MFLAFSLSLEIDLPADGRWVPKQCKNPHCMEPRSFLSWEVSLIFFLASYRTVMVSVHILEMQSPRDRMHCANLILARVKKAP